MESATRDLKYTNFIVRPTHEYSLGAIVQELRVEIRVSWSVMHNLRKQAAAVTGQQERSSLFYAADRVKREMLGYIAILNAGLGRVGSYERTYYRKMRERNAAYKVAAAIGPEEEYAF